jgi:hypothetical protein
VEESKDENGKEKRPDKSDLFSLMLAERTGLAHVPRAADCLARQSLRAQASCFPHWEKHPPQGGHSCAGKEKRPDKSDLFSLMLAERTGLEPATPGVTGRYSNQLNYRSVFTDRFSVLNRHLVGAERLELPT